MSKVIKILVDNYIEDGCDCLETMIKNSVNGSLFIKLQDILEENKENINFISVKSDTVDKNSGNKYTEFLMEKIPKEICNSIELICLAKIIQNFNPKPLSNPILCYNQYTKEQELFLNKMKI